MSDIHKNSLKVLAVIPARGKSKSIPRKNLKCLAEKPLIAYSIKAALQSGCLDRVIVSTDDEEIAEISRQYGAQVPFIRPNELAQDNTDTPSVIIHALDWLSQNENQSYDIVVTLQPTSPLRKAHHITEALNRFLSVEAESLVTVTQVEHPPYWYLVKSGKDFLVPFIKSPDGTDYLKYNRQRFSVVFRPNGAIFITWTSTLQQKKTFYPEKLTYYIMEEKDSVDIDSFYNLELAKFLLSNNF